MIQTKPDSYIIRQDEVILITGATGFIGSRLLVSLLDLGFRNIRCLARPSSEKNQIEVIARRYPEAHVEIVTGNLLSCEDCTSVSKDAAVVFHLAAGTGSGSFPDAFMNSVVTTRNLLEACVRQQSLRRFVNVSSFAVYTNMQKPRQRILDESCPVESRPELRGEPYCYAKVKQEQIVIEYAKEFGIPYVVVRPGYVYGPGRHEASGRVGIDTFGIFLHLGGPNALPFTYVDNCADAIALTGLKVGIDGEVFNVVDDDLPSSRRFLCSYKKRVKSFRSLYVPHAVSYALCYLWEQYSAWSEGQLPPAFNRRRWHAFWKMTRYSNEKLKTRVGWAQKVPTPEGLNRYFEACRNGGSHA